MREADVLYIDLLLTDFFMSSSDAETQSSRMGSSHTPSYCDTAGTHVRLAKAAVDKNITYSLH